MVQSSSSRREKGKEAVVAIGENMSREARDGSFTVTTMYAVQSTRNSAHASSSSRKPILNATPPVATLTRPIVSTVYRLPPETWESVFYDLLKHETSGDTHGTLALVCRFWKEVLYQSKRLWRNVELAGSFRPRLHLRLAQGYPLHVTWHTVCSIHDRNLGSKDSDHFPEDLVRVNASTIEDLSIRANLGSPVKPYLNNVTFPVLRTLYWLSSKSSSHIHFGPSLGSLRTPRLVNIALAQVRVSGLLLASMLSEAKNTLKHICLVDAQITDAPIPASVSLPHLVNMQLLAGEDADDGLLVLFLAIRDIPAQAEVALNVTPEQLELSLTQDGFEDAWHNLFPFRFAQLTQCDDDCIRLIERAHPSRFRLTLDIYQFDHYNDAVNDYILGHIQGLEAVAAWSAMDGGLDLELLPSFRSVMVDQSTAEAILCQLRAPLLSSTMSLAELALDRVPLSASPPAQCEDPDDDWEDEQEAWCLYATLVSALKARAQAGCRVEKLILAHSDSEDHPSCRNVGYEASVLEGLRPWVGELVVEHYRSLKLEDATM